MEAQFTISEGDYIRAMALYSRMTRKQLLLYAAMGGVFFLTAVFAQGAIQGGAIGGIIGLFIVLLVVRPIAIPLLAKRHYRKYKAIQQPFRLRLDAEGLNFSTADGSNLIRWENILKWRQNKDYVLAYPMPRLYYVIPKHIQSQGFDLAGLLAALGERVGKES